MGAEVYKKAKENGVILECTCADIPESKWDKLYEGATRGDKRKIQSIIRNHFEDGWFKLWNPYPCYKTETHLIYIHSATDYFFKIL